MKRVLHVNKFYAPFIGGVERVVQDIAEGLRADFDLRVLACSHDKRAAEEIVGGVPVSRARTYGVLFSMPISSHFVSRFRALAREADLIHFHNPFPLAELLGATQALRGRRIVTTYHSDVVRQAWAMPVYGPVLRRFLRRCDRILVSSDRLKNSSPHLEAVRSRCEVVPFGVRVGEVTSGIEPFALPAKGFILFVGRLVSYKGADVLIRAMKAVEAPLVIVGDGPLRGSLEALARSEGVASRVHFLGRLSWGAIKHCYRECRLFVLPSVMRTEAFGLVQLEAMAFGKPVVNTDLPTGVPEVSRHDETGLTVPPGNSVALGEAIHTILGDPERAERFGRAAAARARDLSMDRFLDRVRRIYQDVLSG